MVKILHDEGASIVRFRRAAPKRRSRVLVVTFTGFEGRRNRRPGFAELALAKAGYDCVAVKMHACNNFLDLSHERMAEILAKQVRRYERVVTYGASGGAYAALYFSEAVQADLNLCISPRNTRDPRYARLTEISRRRAAFTHRRLTDLPRKRAASIVIYDPRDGLDVAYFEREVLPLGRIMPIRFPYSGHPSTRVLGEVGALKAILASTLAHVDDPAAAAREVAAVVRAAQRRRHASPYFLATLMIWSAIRGRVGVFDRLEREIDPVRITPRSATRLRKAYRLMRRRAAFARLAADWAAAHPDHKVLAGMAVDARARRIGIGERLSDIATRHFGEDALYAHRLPRAVRSAARSVFSPLLGFVRRLRPGAGRRPGRPAVEQPVRPGGSAPRRRR